MNKDSFKMMDNVIGVCAGIAAARIVKNEISYVKRNSTDLTAIGCNVISVWVGLKVFTAVAKDTRKIRTSLIKAFFEEEEE